jgi:peptidoglycan/xylan/chitin deacetylase (PgdA/CDA1 family)
MSDQKDEISLKRQLAASSFRYLLGKHWVPTEKWTVLMYHRVTTPEEIPYPIQAGTYVKPETFKMHIDFLKKNARVIPLMDLIKEVEAGERKEKKKTVAITFDDGWSDFATHANPLLEEYELPASVFLPTAYIGTSKLFWSDLLSLHLHALSKVTEKKASILHRIEETLNDRTYIDLIHSYFSNPHTNFSKELDALIEKAKEASEEDRRAFLSSISILAKEYCHPICDSQFLSWEQIQTISQKGLVTFGSHGHQHRLMDQLTREQVKDDITQSIQVFKEKSIPCLPVFCYPNQNRNTTTDEVLRDLDFSYSLGRMNSNEDEASPNPPCLRRVGIHEDVSNSEKLLSFRIWTLR